MPDVTRHVVKAEAVGRIFADFGGGAETAGGKVGARRIGWRVTPREEAVYATARGVLPFGIGGKALALPLAVGKSVIPRDVGDGVIHEPFGNMAVHPVLEILAFAVPRPRIFFCKWLVEAGEFFFRFFAVRKTASEGEELRVCDEKFVEIERLESDGVLWDRVGEKFGAIDLELDW